MKRGFKSRAEGLARELRRELHLRPEHRLDPFELAEHLDIQVCGLSEYGSRTGCSDDAVRYFQNEGQGVFSAAMLCLESSRFILYNDAHSPERQAADIVHELAHVILEHELADALGVGGCRSYSKTVEEEADWLSRALLVPRDGALSLSRRGWGILQMAERFGVSKILCRYRRDVTGVTAQLARARELRKSR